MRDYVCCAECGTMISSDFAVSTTLKGDMLFFCNERHERLYMEDKQL